MARAALGWRTEDLAAHASIGPSTVARFELGTSTGTKATRLLIRQAFEAAGVVFIGNDGVRLPVPENHS
jgi:transcriptional regulator with XRE-family HTH domain